jgi:uncharacterized membrane protein YeiH
MIEALQFLAVVSSGLYGVMLARGKGMDLVGICWVAFVVAFGGGTLRDVLLDRRPLFWIEHEHYTWTLFAIAVAGSFVPKIPKSLDRLLLVPDALGLGLFSVVGTKIAIENPAFHVSPFIAALFGVFAGAFGGVIADVVCNDVPRMFLPSTPLYSLCGFAGCWVFLGLRTCGVDPSISMPAGAATAVVLRLLAVRFGWRLKAKDA